MEKNMKAEILGVKAPGMECKDKKCPFHGLLSVKKERIKGKIVKTDISRSATLEWFRFHYVPKYERYEVRRSRIRAHNPPCLNARIGQEVLAARTRPLSKTKNYVIIQITNANIEEEMVDFLPLEEESEEAERKKTKDHDKEKKPELKPGKKSRSHSIED